jgi:hypothetical protein
MDVGRELHILAALPLGMYHSDNCTHTAGWTVLWTILLLCVISGFGHHVNEIFTFLGYYVALISS